MSLAATTYVLHHRFGNQTRKLIMIAIADFANDAGEAWPSIDTLADRAECSRRSIQEHLNILRAEGHLLIVANAGHKGTHLYRIIFKKSSPAPGPSARGANPARGVQTSGGNPAPGGADHRRPSAPESTSTVMEPSERAKSGCGVPPQYSPPPASGASALAHIPSLSQKINTLRPDTWGRLRGLSSLEKSAITANADAIHGIPLEDWPIMARYLAARLPTGHGGWQPKSRFKAIESIGDIHSHALSWHRKNPPPPPRTTTPPVAERRLLTREEIAESLKPV